MGTPFFIAASELHAALFGSTPPVLFDVARRDLVDKRGTIIPTARLREPDLVPAEAGGLGAFHVVVACAHGHNRSQAVAGELRAAGVQASVLADGFDGWTAAGLPVVKRTAAGVALGEAPTTWVTRRLPKIDRVACPWLIRRFLDAQARVLFVEPDQVLAVAADVGGAAFDLPGAPFEHDGPLCTFDTLLAAFGLSGDPVLAELAVVVRGADTDRLDLAPQCAGLLAVSLGLSARHEEDDAAMLRDGLLIYDALHSWLSHARGERHHWPRAA